MLYLNGFPVNVKQFPNGESFADVASSIVKSNKNVIKMHFQNDEDILFLQFLKDFVDELAPKSEVILNMPYIPYSRMDRKEESRLFTLKSFVKMINRMNFSCVHVMEPHSEVSVALLDRVKVENKSIAITKNVLMNILGLKGSDWLKPNYVYSKNPEDFTLEGLYDRAKEKNIYLVYPDAGASKRYSKQIDYPNYITCSKKRDFNSGNINYLHINEEDYKDVVCDIAIIVDDLCSKGGTFVGAADELRRVFPNIKEIYLVVTHCENNILNGVIPKGEDITKVYTTNSIFTDYGDSVRQTDPFSYVDYIVRDNIVVEILK